MDDDLVLLTSYFNLVNGRRQDTADTFRVDPSLPSTTSPDGTASLYIATQTGVGSSLGARARRLAADTIAWEYSSHGSEPPAPRLKAALRAAHDAVQSEFDGHVSVGVSVVAVEHRDVYLAQAAPAQVYVLHEGSLHSIAATVPGASPYQHALGAPAGPQISVFRDEIAAGDVLALCTSTVQESADADELRECFGAGSADDIAAALLDLSQQHSLRDATAIIIEAAEADVLDEVGDGEAHSFTEQVDVAVQALTNVGRMLWNELRTPSVEEGEQNGHAPADTYDLEDTAEVPASRPRRSRRVREEEHTSEVAAFDPYPEEPPAEEPAEWNPDDTASWDLTAIQPRQRTEQATEEVPALPSEEPEEEFAPSFDSHAPESEAPSSFEPEPEVEPEPPPVSQPARRRRTLSELEAVNARLQQDVDLGGEVLPPVQAFPEPSTTEPSRIYATSRDVAAANRRPRRRGGVARDSAGSTPVLRPGLSDIDLRQRVNRPTPSALVWLAAAVLGIFAVAAVVLFVRHHGTTTASNPYPAEVRRDLRRARAAKSPAAQASALAGANSAIALAAQNGSSTSQVRSLRHQYQVTSDSIYHVTRVTSPVTLASFQRPTEVAVSPDTVFVLDAGKQAVYSVNPNSTSAPTDIVQSGEADSGLTIGTPTQIATSGSIALVYDSKTQLVRDDTGTKTATFLSPPSPHDAIVGMINFGPDIFLLDAAGNQVWRYADAVNADNTVPSPVLPTNASQINGPVSFTIDDRDLFILKNNGQVLKFDTQQFNGQAFKNGPVPAGGLHHGVSVFTDVGLGYVWVADPGDGRIVQFTKDGKYVRSYQPGASAGLNFHKLKALAVPPSGKTIYALVGTHLVSFPVVP